MSVRLRLGFAGCGEVSVEKHMPALRELSQFEITAVADIDPSRLALVNRRFGPVCMYENIDCLLGDHGLDAIAVCLPPALQASTATAALDAGKHVWIEPPIGLTTAECDSLITRASVSDRVVTVGFHMRWHRLVREARNIVDSGRLGLIQSIRCVWNSPRRDDKPFFPSERVTRSNLRLPARAAGSRCR
jgi:myo-inositol 2-dehydrogenase / D-chiro-inositol 1-dehydrogenase